MAGKVERCTIHVPWEDVSTLLKIKECAHYQPEDDICTFKGEKCPTLGRLPKPTC